MRTCNHDADELILASSIFHIVAFSNRIASESDQMSNHVANEKTCRQG